MLSFAALPVLQILNILLTKHISVTTNLFSIVRDIVHIYNVHVNIGIM